MPEYMLPLDSTESHEWFDSLPEIARGYVEAAFFTGATALLPDLDSAGPEDRPEPVEIESAGPAMLPQSERAAMESRAVRFWIESAGLLAAALAHGGDAGGYDLAQAGRDLWFTESGAGVGFGCRGLDQIGDRLETAAGLRDSCLLAEPAPDAPAAPDPEDPEHWQVYVEPAEAALSAVEREAAETLDSVFAEVERRAAFGTPAALREPGEKLRALREAMQWRDGSESRDSIVSGVLRALRPAESGGERRPLPEAGGAYGAPMGRRSGNLAGGEPVRAERVALDPGGYDSGGAYWGARPPGVSLWRVTGTESGAAVYVDARSRAEAIAEADPDSLEAARGAADGWIWCESCGERRGTVRMADALLCDACAAENLESGDS